MGILNDNTRFIGRRGKVEMSIYGARDEHFMRMLKRKIEKQEEKALAERGIARSSLVSFPKDNEDCFVIQHYLSDVTYNTIGLVERNIDSVNLHMLNTIHLTPDCFPFIR